MHAPPPSPPWVIGPIISNIYPVLSKSEIFWSYLTLKFNAQQLLHHSWSRDKIILIGPTDHISNSSHWSYAILMFDVESKKIDSRLIIAIIAETGIYALSLVE